MLLLPSLLSLAPWLPPSPPLSSFCPRAPFRGLSAALPALLAREPSMFRSLLSHPPIPPLAAPAFSQSLRSRTLDTITPLLPLGAPVLSSLRASELPPLRAAPCHSSSLAKGMIVSCKAHTYVLTPMLGSDFHADLHMRVMHLHLRVCVYNRIHSRTRAHTHTCMLARTHVRLKHKHIHFVMRIFII